MRKCATHTDMNLRADTARKSNPKLPIGVWIGGVTARTLFLLILTVLTARVASPQIERLSSLYETPGDLIRVALGFAVCMWFIVNLFILPKDAGAYRTGCTSGWPSFPYPCFALSSFGESRLLLASKKLFNWTAPPSHIDANPQSCRPSASRHLMP
jgi:hypothetical protein